MMISIVTAYYNRKKLFVKTLESIKSQKFEGSFEVIAVDDGSNENERLEDLIQEYPFLKVIRLEKENKWYHNSCIPFNIGFRAAKGDKIIIQNPECFHYGNILKYTHQNLADNKYLSFACFSLDKTSTEDIDKIFANRQIDEVIAKNNECIKNDGDAGWYNHSIYRPKGYHFCTSIKKSDLHHLGGFDEMYSLGIAYDDDDLLSRIKKKKMDIQFIDSEIVLHQNHYSPNSTSFENREYKTALIDRNKKLFTKLSNKSYVTANIISNKIGLNSKKYYIKIILNVLERI